MTLRHSRRTLLNSLVLIPAILFCLGCTQTDRPAGTTTPAPQITSTPQDTASPSSSASPAPVHKEWVKSEIANGRLSILAPDPMGVQDGGPATIIYATPDEKYAVIVVDGESMDEDHEKGLESLKAAILEKTGGEEVHSEKTEFFEGRPAIRFGMKVKAGEQEVPVEMLLTFLEEAVLIQAAVTNGDHEQFFGSFEVTGVEKEQPEG